MERKRKHTETNAAADDGETTTQQQQTSKKMSLEDSLKRWEDRFKNNHMTDEETRTQVKIFFAFHSKRMSTEELWKQPLFDCVACALHCLYKSSKTENGKKLAHHFVHDILSYVHEDVFTGPCVILFVYAIETAVEMETHVAWWQELLDCIVQFVYDTDDQHRPKSDRMRPFFTMMFFIAKDLFQHTMTPSTHVSDKLFEWFLAFTKHPLRKPDIIDADFVFGFAKTFDELVYIVDFHFQKQVTDPHVDVEEHVRLYLENTTIDSQGGELTRGESMHPRIHDYLS